MNSIEKHETYKRAWQNIQALIAGERDETAVLATVEAEVSRVYGEVDRFASGETRQTEAAPK